jgi:mannosyltransferase OCH1-like enzyme
MRPYPPGFEEQDNLRSVFIRELMLHLLNRPSSFDVNVTRAPKAVPRTLIQYWHDPANLPDDVLDCLASWHRLVDEGVEIRMFCDASAALYITERFGTRESKAFERCRHPAMRSDYFRMCFLLQEGGLYVDADDVLVGDGWQELFGDDRLKVQPLCYDIPTAQMVPAAEVWRPDLSTEGRIFYVNNNPIAAPAGHPVLRAALSRSTDRLLGDDLLPEIQATTGPGNLTAALAGHARNLFASGAPLDFDLMRDWGGIAETCWHLSYRCDARNWRNMDVG